MWGTLVHHITRIDPSDTPGSSIVYLLWKDGQESKHMMSIAQEKCPHLVLIANIVGRVLQSIQEIQNEENVQVYP
jgi:hypothetical protein